MITLKDVTVAHGGRTLFENVTITFANGRFGLTGPNGAGKSTLLRVIMGMEEPNGGSVQRPQRIGWLKQNIQDFEQFTVMDVVMMGNERLWSAFTERDSLYEQEMTDEVGMRLGDLEEIIAEEDGYSAETKAEILLLGVGIPETLHQEYLGNLPLGDQFKILLCQSLFGEPEALLLDEPTNHLDLEAITWLEDFLCSYEGTLIVVSHDRHFLNAVTTDIADIDYETVIHYPGNYDSMVVAKTAVRSRAESEAKSKQKKIDQLKEFVQRFGAGSRASQVQSRIREIKRLEPQDLKKSNIQRPYIRFFASEKAPGKILLKLQGIHKGYDGKEVLKGLDLEVQRGDKIGVIGNNGRGKTTLLKIIAQVHEVDEGESVPGHQAMISYFPQSHKEVVDKKNCQDTVLQWLQRAREGLYEQDIRSALGKLLFSGDDAFKNVATLSGGETARLILAKMMLEEHNCIIMDEPNNHLDLESVSALSWGLEQYPETVVVASHDRDLIGNVANRIVAFEEDGVHVFNGPLEDYLESRKEQVG